MSVSASHTLSAEEMLDVTIVDDYDEDDCLSLGCCNRLGGFNSKHLFLTVLEDGKSTVKVLEDSVYDEGLLLGS